MKKLTALFLTLTLILTLAACAEAEPEPMKVYSFSGEDERFAISNGVIVVSSDNEIFSGGDFKAVGDAFSDTASYTAAYYIMSGNEKRTVLSVRVVDTTGSSAHIDGDLGQISGADIITGAIRDNADNWEKSLYFELVTTDMNGAENTYQLQMTLKEITKEIDEN